MGYFSQFLGCKLPYMHKLWVLFWESRMLSPKDGLGSGWNVILSQCYFKNSIIVPRRLQSRCLNCMVKTKHTRIHVTHIFREGNYCAEKLANFGISSKCCTWWDNVMYLLQFWFFQRQISTSLLQVFLVGLGLVLPLLFFFSFLLWIRVLQMVVVNCCAKIVGMTINIVILQDYHFIEKRIFQL